MSAIADPIEACFREVELARLRVSRMRSRQITRSDDRDYLKSVAYAWFRSHRPLLVSTIRGDALEPIDLTLKKVLDATSRSSTKSTYVGALKEAKDALASLRGLALVLSRSASTIEPPPEFGSLASDPAMKAILQRRWDECQKCLRAGAPLAATVMMGGLLEALFVARANLMAIKAPLFRAKATPIDSRTKKPMALTEWTLRPYIDVGSELGWISRSGKDVASVLRDYRNYVHPEKERAHGLVLTNDDSKMFWDLTKTLVRQLLASALLHP